MNDTNDLDKKIASLILFLDETPSIIFEEERYTIEKTEGNKNKLTTLNIPFEEYDNKLRIQLKKYFEKENVKYAPALISEIDSEDINNDLLVIDAVKKMIIKFNCEDKKFHFWGNNDKLLEYYLKNIISYYSLFNFLKSTSFSDYFNDANNEIIIYSSAKGIFKIKYETRPTIVRNEDISERVKRLFDYATPLELRPFFKNAIFAFTNEPGHISLNEIISKAVEIISVTERDHELVSKQFDFDKFRDTFYKEKEKYFLNIREIINKIFSQAIGIPISISASVFATYKVSDDDMMLLLILIAFLAYTVFYIKIQLVYRADIVEIQNDFLNDFNIISSKSGLSPQLIDTEKLKIDKKITSSIFMIDLLIGFVILLGLLVACYIYYETTKNTITPLPPYVNAAFSAPLFADVWFPTNVVT